MIKFTPPRHVLPIYVNGCVIYYDNSDCCSYVVRHGDTHTRCTSLDAAIKFAAEQSGHTNAKKLLLIQIYSLLHLARRRLSQLGNSEDGELYESLSVKVRKIEDLIDKEINNEHDTIDKNTTDVSNTN